MTVSPRALTFGEMAEEYDLWRPGYPDAAVDWLAPTAPATVVEIGAGTGRLTGRLLARGLEVDAVEPDPRMRAVLARNHPTARCHASDSTSLPVRGRVGGRRPRRGRLALVRRRGDHARGPTRAEAGRVARPGVERGGRAGGGLGARARGARHVRPDHQGRPRRRTPTPAARRPGRARVRAARVGLGPHARPPRSEPRNDLDGHRHGSAEREEWLAEARAELQDVCDAQGRDSMPIRHLASCTRWTPR